MTTIRINSLDNQLVNHIAAGEVIERPAAVVKELIENSLDAQATEIQCQIIQSGKQLISVRDNGCGIHADDLALAVARHATSKIKSLEDLEAIHTLGFRGEALASMAAVSQFKLTSRTAQSDCAWQIAVAGGVVQPLVPCAHPIGTSIEVAELFFNTPVRRRFMRSDRTEFLQIEEMIKRFALSAFGTAFTLLANDKLILKCSKLTDTALYEQRLKQLLPISFSKHALYIDAEIPQMRLHGWITPPHTSLSSASQYLFLNGRAIKDRTFSHALKLVYQELSSAEIVPNFVLYLDVDPHQVDVNVHPTKQEVRWQEQRLMHDFVHSSLLNALQTKPQISIVPQTKLTAEILTQDTKPPSISYPLPQTTKPILKVEQQMALYERVIKAPTAAPKVPHMQFLTQLKPYFLAQVAETLVVFDIFLMKECLLLASFLTQGSTKPLAFPKRINNLVPITGLQQKITRLNTLQVQLHVSENDIALHALPTSLYGVDLTRWLTNILQNESLWQEEHSTAFASQIARAAVDCWQSPHLVNEQSEFTQTCITFIQQQQQTPQIPLIQQLIAKAWRSLTAQELAQL